MLHAPVKSHCRVQITFIVVAARQAYGHPVVVAEGKHGCAFRDSHVGAARVDLDSVG